MPTATLTSKGQITVPKEVRDALRLQPGNRLAFLIRADGVVELRPATVHLRDLLGLLERKGAGVTVEAMDAAIGEAIVESYDRTRH